MFLINRIGHEIISLKQCSSTNEYASQLIKKNNVSNGLVVKTDYQYEGKGHSGSKWESNKKENLIFSIILLPEDFIVDWHFYLSKFVSVAICKCLRKYISNTYIKWPNDIICDNKKICGILIENTIEKKLVKSSVIGIGLNINQNEFSEDVKATSLSLEIGHNIDADIFFNELLNLLNDEFDKLSENNFNDVDNDYITMLFWMNTWNNFRKDGKIFKGKITGISDYGELLIENITGETLKIGFKEVEFLF